MDIPDNFNELLEKAILDDEEHDDVEDIKTVLLSFFDTIYVGHQRGMARTTIGEYMRSRGHEKAADIIERWENERK